MLITPISLFAGLRSLHFGLFSKFSLWSLRVMNASLSAKRSILSARFSDWEIFFASLVALVFLVFFGYVVVEEFCVSIRFEFVDFCSFVCWD